MNGQVDTLVIGAGVIGVCAAYYSIEQGRQVTIVERDTVCSGSSYGNGGLIVPSHSVPLAAPGAVIRALKWMLNPESPFYVKPRLDPRLFSWLWRFRAACTERRMRDALHSLLELSLASKELYEELVPREGIECNYAESGLVMLYRSDSGYRHGLEEARLLQEHGLSIREMTGEQVHDMEPMVRDDITGGVYYEDDANLTPAEFVLGLAARVQDKGGAIDEGTEVLGFESSGGRIVTVRTTKGDYYPEHVVLAAGSWSPMVARDLRFNLPVQAAKGYSVTFETPGRSLGLPVILSEARVGVSPMGSAMRLAGTLELSGLDLTINSRRVKAVMSAVDDYLVGGEQLAKEEQAWAGLRPLAPDGLPIIGPAGPVSNLIVATGHAMMGMTLGPITGKLVAQLVAGQATSLDLAPFSPQRFR